jgi:hypothetical protein
MISQAFGTNPLEQRLLDIPVLESALKNHSETRLIYEHLYYADHCETVRKFGRGNLRILVLTRHPIDRMISQLAKTRAENGPYPDYALPAEECARQLLLGEWDGRPWANSFVVDDMAAHHNENLRNRVTLWIENFECKLIRFEDLVTNTRQVVQEIFEYLGVFPPEVILRKIIDQNSFAKLSGGRMRGERHEGSHYRSGLIGEWTRVFGPADLPYLKARYEGAFEAAGYALDHSSWLSYSRRLNQDIGPSGDDMGCGSIPKVRSLCSG